LTKLKFNEENKKLIRRNAFYLKEYLQLKSSKVIFNCLLIYYNFFLFDIKNAENVLMNDKVNVKLFLNSNLILLWIIA
jgi:hypothetical protein